ncbi:NADPH:quinone reductase-like Zn-dependent oxidoreductase [Robbsia andropogonis]|uniref:NADP-dependent oxidoreductase n=1 Tax=Robbsia andropogonis TaxID=28092 RepID=UPI000AFA00D2|nr:NADP-dependent oxidoreductase [Robbsia andropogonis]
MTPSSTGSASPSSTPRTNIKQTAKRAGIASGDMHAGPRVTRPGKNGGAITPTAGSIRTETVLEGNTRSVRIHAFGGPETLRIDTIALPSLRAGESLVRVEAAGVNPLDFKIREGRSVLVDAGQLPYALGRDFAGVVECVSGEGTGLHVGDRVFGMLGIDRGAYAEHVVVKPGEACIRPAQLGATEAAAVPVAALTAWQGLFDQGRLQAGQSVLILGAAGGVGHFAVQFARAHGAYVIALEQTEEGADFARSMGADVSIDMSHETFEPAVLAALAHRTAGTSFALPQQTSPAGVDVVFDLIGSEIQHRAWDVLRDGGALISTVMEPCEYEAALRRVRARHFVAHPSAAQLRDIAQLIERGQVRVIVEDTYGFMQAGDAHQRLQAGTVHGKLVLTTRPDAPPRAKRTAAKRVN